MKSWFSVTNKADAPAAEILIFDEIGLWGVTAKNFADALSQVPSDRPLIVGINSPGGSVPDGVAIFNLLKSRANVTTRIDGWAASIAGYIFCAGSRRIMPANSLFMMHFASSGAWGESEELKKVAELLDKINDQIVAEYVAITGKKDDEIRALMADETWMNASEAKDAGICTEISGATAANARASFDFRRFKNGPKNPVSAEPEVKTPSNPQDTKMKTLLAALAAASFIPSADCSEEDAVKAFKNANAALVDEMANLRSQVENTTKAAAEAFVAQAVKDGKIKDDAKLRERWVKNYVADASGTQEMVNAMETPKRGAPPIPQASGTPGDPAAPKEEKKPELFGRERIAASFKKQFESLTK